MRTIFESGLEFGDLDENRLFQIENSDIRRKAGSGIKSVEFIYLIERNERNDLIFVEAKSSCPNPLNKEDSKVKSEKYEEYFTDITEKFIDSINLFAATAMGRYENHSEIGIDIRKKNTYEGTGMKFILVISQAREEWLQGPKIELERRLQKYKKIWKADVIVLNKALAEKYGIVKES